MPESELKKDYSHLALKCSSGERIQDHFEKHLSQTQMRNGKSVERNRRLHERECRVRPADRQHLTRSNHLLSSWNNRVRSLNRKLPYEYD
jgi:hypothetical protein